jgi:hypothetical protein
VNSIDGEADGQKIKIRFAASSLPKMRSNVTERRIIHNKQTAPFPLSYGIENSLGTKLRKIVSHIPEEIYGSAKLPILPLVLDWGGN